MYRSQNMLVDSPITRDDGFLYWLIKLYVFLAGTPLAFIAGIVGGWAYLGYALLTNTEHQLSRSRIFGGWMISLVVGWGAFEVFETTMRLPGNIALLASILLASSGNTGYKALLDRVKTWTDK